MSEDTRRHLRAVRLAASISWLFLASSVFVDRVSDDNSALELFNFSISAAFTANVLWMIGILIQLSVITERGRSRIWGKLARNRAAEARPERA